MPRAASPYNREYERERARILARRPHCHRCGGPGADSTDHVPALARHRHVPGSRCCVLVPAHLACNVDAGRKLGTDTIRRKAAARRRAAGRTRPPRPSPMSTRLVPPRIGSRRHPDVPTIGPIVDAVAKGMGLALHPWQRYRADVCGELTTCATGRRLAAGVTGTMVGRQSGKTTAVACDVATRCLAPDIPELAELVGHTIGPQHVAFTAQDRIGALGRWYEHVEMIMASELREYVRNVARKNGEECMWFRNGSFYKVVTPSKTGARGLSLDVCVIDEALAHPSELLSAIRPTMAQRDGARVSFGAQLIIVSNAGDDDAELLNDQRELGRRAAAEDDRARAWLEWSCADDADVLDPATWAATLPTLDQPDGISSAFLELEAETIGTDTFAREYLCRTVAAEAHRVIPPDVWDESPRGALTQGAVSILAVDCTPDRASSAVVAAGLQPPLTVVQLVEQRDGTEWLSAYVPMVARRLRVPVMLDAYGPAAPLIPGLRAEGVEVIEARSREVVDAAAAFVDAVMAGQIAHPHDPGFAAAIGSLSRRRRGDRWCFDRHHGDIAPIVAASLAAWQLSPGVALTPSVY